jgi:predicted DNA binding CopG/RHH family protein
MQIKAVEAQAKLGKEPMNIRIDSGLKQRLKVHCAANGITMQDFLTEALENALMAAEKKTGSTKRS